MNGIQEVRGSIPLTSTKLKALEILCFRAFLFLETFNIDDGTHRSSEKYSSKKKS